jgi:hypothetical protein
MTVKAIKAVKVMKARDVCRYADCHNAECSYADCSYADCHNAECLMLSISF